MYQKAYPNFVSQKKLIEYWKLQKESNKQQPSISYKINNINWIVIYLWRVILFLNRIFSMKQIFTKLSINKKQLAYEWLNRDVIKKKRIKYGLCAFDDETTWDIEKGRLLEIV